jgi:hypothetical protein
VLSAEGETIRVPNHLLVHDVVVIEEPTEP